MCIPVFNERERIGVAIDSAARQGVRVLVSDNCSTDGTSDVCREKQGEYNNISCFFRDKNYGASGNFQFLLEKVESDFVMFLGAHDYLDDGYCGAVLSAFLEDPSVVVACGELRLDAGTEEAASRFVEWAGGVAPQECERVKSFLFTFAPMVWLTYGVFRTDVLRSCVLGGLPIYGADVFLLVRALRFGKALVVKGVSYHAHVRKTGSTEEYIERITGACPKKKEVDAMRKAFRRMKYESLVRACGYRGLRAIVYRGLFMIRSGFFITGYSDVVGMLLFLPVKLSRFFRIQNLIWKYR